MSYFAELDNQRVVKRVIVADQSFIDSGQVGDPKSWVETSYERSFRKNYAGIGYQYDVMKEGFIPPKPYDSWILDESTCEWRAPKPIPVEVGKVFIWDEGKVDWVGVRVKNIQ